MDWEKLKIFHVVAEAGSFTHAGEALGLSQSAVSRQISALEQELKVPLFHRHARGLILTEQGEVLFRTAHEVFMKLEAARTKLTDSRERPNGELKVQTTPGIGVHWLTPRLGEFLDLYPDIHITLITSDEELDLAMREAGEDFSNYAWSFVDGVPLLGDGVHVPAKTDLSERISKDLKKRGFKFVGPTIVYAWMQAIGLVNDHAQDCFRRDAVG